MAPRRDGANHRRANVLGRVFGEAMVASARANTLVKRGTAAWANLVGGALSAALTEEEMAAITLRLYDDSHELEWQDFGLRAWEHNWFDAALPPPPARLLIGAAGGGREVKALLAQGYSVDAFEPAEAAHAQLQGLAGERCRVAGCTYAEWVAGEAFGSARYDAVILGWGSLSHVMTAASREAIWRAADACCEGPLLASFYALHRHRIGRAERVGRRLGGVVGRLRGIEAAHRGVKYADWGGFSEPLTVEEVEQVAADLGRQTRWGLRTQWPYVTLLGRDPMSRDVT